MKVFKYNITPYHLKTGKYVFFKFLIHDNTIFNGVDERQVARALDLAAKEAENSGFQYIVTLINSDQVPYDEFENAVMLKLTDLTEYGGLLGVRW